MKHKCNREYFENIDTEHKAYWLGFIAADGSVSNTQLHITLQCGDIQHLGKFQQAIIGTQKPYIYTNAKSNQSANIVISSTKMISDLNKHGVIKNKSNGFVPWDGPLHLLKHYYRGLFDGDGWICQSRRRQYWQVGFCGCESIVRNFASFVKLKSYRREKDGLWITATSGIKKAREAIATLYTNANISLDRKFVLVNKLLQAKTERDLFEKYHWISLETLNEWHTQYGSWREVEKATNVNRLALRKLKLQLSQ